MICMQHISNQSCILRDILANKSCALIFHMSVSVGNQMIYPDINQYSFASSVNRRRA